MQQMILSTVLRSLAAVVIGGLIGSERARYKRRNKGILRNYGNGYLIR